MAENENRQIPRDSLLMTADLRLHGERDEHRVQVRNLSPGGMMAEGAVEAERGALVEVHLRNLGWVTGAVAWVQDHRFGIAFRADIDPAMPRLP